MQETLPSVQELKQEFIYGKLSEESPSVTGKAPLELNLPIQKAVQKEDLMPELSRCLVDQVRRRSSFFFQIPNSEVLPRGVSNCPHDLIFGNTLGAVFSTGHFLRPRLMQWDLSAARAKSLSTTYIVLLAEKAKSHLAMEGCRLKRGPREYF